MTRRVPLLRHGRPYWSLDEVRLDDIATGEAAALVSQANPGLIAHDGADSARRQQILGELTVTELLAVCRRASDLFATAELPLGDGTQTADDYIAALSSTTGLPHTLARLNMGKLQRALAEMDGILAGLTRGIDLQLLDVGHGVQNGRRLGFMRLASSLGAILPNNSPGVHALWLPSIALKVPLVLRPGRREPWTPIRLAQALIAAGCPPEAISCYPSGHDGATQILLRTDRALLFGDGATVAPWRTDARVQIHGPGRSKVLIADDLVDGWRDLLEPLVKSIAVNSGRSCLNASGVWVSRHGAAIAAGLAERLATILPLPLDDPRAELAAFESVAMARAISGWIDKQLEIPGAVEVGVEQRGPRLVEAHGCAFILPTVIHCTDPEHPLANTELLFPFASVVEVAPEELLSKIGPTLVGSVFTADLDLQRRLISCRDIDRLNLGVIPTSQIDWDQPHEGNLFAHLYTQRALAISA